MVGITHSDFYAGEDCYIVLQKPDGGQEFLEGKFLETLPETHHAWQELRNRGLSEYARPVRAMVVSVQTSKRKSIDSIAAGQEPFRDYTVISTEKYITGLEQEVLKVQSEAAAAREGLASKLVERDMDLSLVTQDFAEATTKQSGQYEAAIYNVQNQMAAMQKSTKKYLCLYLAIGVAFGVGASFGVMAMYKNYQSSQAQKPETVIIRK